MNLTTQNAAPLDPDELDRRIVLATQSGLPLVAEPYHQVAAQLGVSADLVMDRIRTMQHDGRIRRIGVVPNHYRLGYVANGMSVWDIPDEFIDDAGHEVGQLDFVSHCYHRPRRLPEWPYNLFAMIHGKTREQVERLVAGLAEQLGERTRCHAVLYSSRILKKTGMRLAD
ncbi:MAG: Lrp/AsnC family transcriptional regulator [Chromatiales bacterium]|nr:Lrp/AsnC family transcriptional regulator [Chromatiales bacterium]